MTGVSPGEFMTYSAPTSSFAKHLNREELLVQGYLLRALEEFGQSLLTIQLIKRLAAETPESFCSAALGILLCPDESPGQRYIATLLLNQNRMLRMLAEPWRFTLGEAIVLFSQLMASDRSLDVRLAHCLPTREGSAAPGFDVPPVERALEILDETSTGRRIVPILGHLVQHVESRISSKAALVIGKRVQSLAWTERQLKHSVDRRLRANAVEAIWGLESPKSRILLWDHTRDPHNRVAGNSIVGLHLLGEEKIPEMLCTMANHPEAAFRATSCWTMGKIGNSDCLPELQTMIKDEDSKVRSAALNAMLKIRKEEARKQASVMIPAEPLTREPQPEIEQDGFRRTVKTNEPRVMSW